MSSGRTLIDRFVDRTTGYVVRVEQRTDDPADRDVYFTLVDPRTDAIIPTAQRAADLARGEQVTTDAAHQLQLAVRHEIDLRTGAETLHEQLVDLASGRVIARGQRTALSANPEPTLLESHLARRAEAASWGSDYPRMSRDEKQAWWLQHVMLQMRFQGESGEDELAMFTPEAYATWRAQEPEIDRMLDFVIDHLPSDRDLRAEIDRRLGR